MDKQQLLAMIADMPDDLFVSPISLIESARLFGEWESQLRHTQLGGVYQRNVENTLVLRLNFKTREQGEFRRSYTDSDGTFFNMQRVR